MDDRRIGRLIRAGRVRKGWRQADLEAASGVDQTTISLVENGRLGGLTLHVIRAIATAVDVPVELMPRMLAADTARLLDQGHGGLVEMVLSYLRLAGWRRSPSTRSTTTAIEGRSTSSPGTPRPGLS